MSSTSTPRRVSIFISRADIQREANPNGDRVNVVLSGKFLPYKQY